MSAHDRPADQQVLTDAEIAEAFKGSDFGSAIPRKLLEQGVLKSLTGYHSGHTLTTIMRKLGLITAREAVTAKGKRFVFWAFHRMEHDG